ncbi:MAG: trigger factor [Muribaculaceae bacterium]|nr:trigger factor [Muribaculaceae bacterium]
MNVNYEKLDDVNGQVVITIDENDYADEVKKQLKEIGKKHAEPGFRPGHVPAGLLQKKYGQAVKYDAINNVVANALSDYIKEQNLPVLGNPVAVKNEEFDINGKDFTFTFKLGLAPEFDTHVNKEMHIPYYQIQISDEMVDTQDKALRRRFGKQEPGEEVDATALVKGVITELDAEGQPKAEGIVVEDGIVAPEYFKSEDQKNVFMGKKVGDSFTFNPAATCEGNETELASMLHIDKADTAAHHGDFRFDVKEIIVLKPAEHGEEFYNAVFGPDKVHDEEEYDKALRDVIREGLTRDSNYRFSIDAKDAIQKAVGKLQLPDEVLKEYLKQQNESLTDENIDEQYAAMLPQFEWELVRDAVARQLEVKVTEEDLRNLAVALAQQQFAQYGMASVPTEVLEKYAGEIMADKRFHNQLVSQAVDINLYDAIRNAVSTDEKDVTVEEFNALFAPAAAE